MGSPPYCGSGVNLTDEECPVWLLLHREAVILTDEMDLLNAAGVRDQDGYPPPFDLK